MNLLETRTTIISDDTDDGPFDDGPCQEQIYNAGVVARCRCCNVIQVGMQDAFEESERLTMGRLPTREW